MTAAASVTSSEEGPDHGAGVWLVLAGRARVTSPNVALFWNEEDARVYAEDYVRRRWPDGADATRDVGEPVAQYNMLVPSAEHVAIRHAFVRGLRRRCRFCGEPVVLDDPADPMSWIHTDDANLLSDHTAEI
jgi:hypothetical protein